MPLFRIETRSKPPTEAAPPPEQPRPERQGEPESEPGGVGPAIVAGALVGVLAIGLISAYMISQRRPAPAASPGPPPVATGVAEAPAGLPSLANVPPLNTDYPRPTIIAWVSGEAYRMEDLEIAVRVAKALASIAGDPVAGYGAPAMRDFQIAMLRREVDGLLMRQALRRAGLEAPVGDVGPAVDGYLQQYGGSAETLAAALTANGISRTHLDHWFAQSRDVQFFIQTQLMAGRQPEEQESVVREWLAQQWATQDIRISFYDPATPASPGAPATP